MIYNKILKGDAILLRQITLADCTETYLNWLNDIKVNKFLETRWHVQDLPTIKEFVESVRESDHSYLFAIVTIKDNKHIGNIKIGPIHPHYSYADISYFIGETDAWGKGIATEAISLITQFGFEELNLNRVQAGVFASNYGSRKALEKVGFTLEACLREQLYTAEFVDDHVYYGILNREFKK